MEINDKELFEQYKKTGDIKIKNQIAVKHQKLVTYVVNKFYSKRQDHKDLRDDLLQEGRIGLLSAIDGYKPELGYQFSTYGCLWIKQTINNFLLGNQPLIHVPGNIRTLQNKVLKQLKDENVELNDFLTSSENISMENVSKKSMKAVNASLKSKFISSFEDIIYSASGSADGQNIRLKDIIPDTETASAEAITDGSSLTTAIQKSLNSLTEKEKYVLLLRFNVITDIPENEVGQ